MEAPFASAKRHRDSPPEPLSFLGSTPHRRRLSNPLTPLAVENINTNLGAEEAALGWFKSTRGALDPEDPWVLGSDSLGIVVHAPHLIPCESGQSCGVSFVCDRAGSPCGVFKPEGEAHVPEELCGALSLGENMYREQAAYVVSRELGGLFGVPATVVTWIRSPSLAGGEQRGSLQRFVSDAVDMTDMGPSHIADDQVHKVGMLDLLLLNLDRHEGNMLMKTSRDGSRVLIPIDHGLSLPLVASPAQPPDTCLLEQLSFVWQSWQHSSRPFSAPARALAASLTQRRVRALARAVSTDAPGISRHSLTTLQIGGVVLRVCVGAGMTLREVAGFVQQRLGKALVHAHRVSKRLAGGKHVEWEAAFLAALEATVRRMMDDGEEWELCAGFAEAQFE